MPDSVEARIARVDQHLSDFEREANRRFDKLEKEVGGMRRMLATFALTVAASSVGVVLSVVAATGHLH